MYYEVHGSGQPLVLLHGGLDTIDRCFARLRPALAADRLVGALELQGHGRTADAGRPLSYEQLADDVSDFSAPTGAFGMSPAGVRRICRDLPPRRPGRKPAGPTP
jgi:pimeloyl-ACP methyl ester carboxylesterase